MKKRKKDEKKKQKRKKGKLFLALISLFLIVAVSGILCYRKVCIYRSRFSQLDIAVNEYLENRGFSVLEKKIKKKGVYYLLPQAERIVDIPFNCSLDKFPQEMEEYFGAFEGSFLRLKEKNESDIYHLEASLGFDNYLTQRLDFILRKAKLALLIDDFGYRDDTVVDLFLNKIDIPLTISIIPGTPFAQSIANKAEKSGKEVILHLPMQPQGDFVNDYRWIILKGMSSAEIKETFREALRDVPQARGVNNHMGSLITTRQAEMKPLLEEIKKARLYFVDSKTASNSIAYSLAQKMGVRTAQNKMFLDNEKRIDYIRERFQKMVVSLNESEKVIGLGHVNQVTGEAILNFISHLDQRKVKLVYISEIVE